MSNALGSRAAVALAVPSEADGQKCVAGYVVEAQGADIVAWIPFEVKDRSDVMEVRKSRESEVVIKGNGSMLTINEKGKTAASRRGVCFLEHVEFLSDSDRARACLQCTQRINRGASG